MLFCTWDFPARILEWVAISFRRGSPQPRNQTWVSCTAGRFFTDWAQSVRGYLGASPQFNNLTHADDSTTMAESKLKSLLMKVKVESEKAGWKLNIQKSKITASSPITSWQIDEEKVKTVTEFIFLVSKITADSDCSHKIKESCSLEEKLWQT